MTHDPAAPQVFQQFLLQRTAGLYVEATMVRINRSMQHNPAAVIKGNAARFGAPILIDLGGRGIRGIERVGKEYVTAAGPVADDGTFALYR